MIENLLKLRMEEMFSYFNNNRDVDEAVFFKLIEELMPSKNLMNDILKNNP